ncbi:hypothetical protein [Aeromonas caviae]|uniref:hypothetical protein n=1 Tax=Aeromonas caviae TaxID=648 RepID=UPI001BCACA79|nr:hypothetical protein [Aeromonas caviae]MBS4713935.1 hypothetical protein [Aeromonas caviae]
MKLADAVLLGALGVLAWSQWQEWRLNRDDAIDIPYHGVPTASLWQCGLLIKEMAALAEQGGEERSGSRGEALAEMDQHLHKTWQREGCSRLTDMQ